MATTTLDYLIMPLRLHLGDTDSSAYRYLDEWLLTALVLSVKTLQRWWNFRYLVADDEDVYRNPNSIMDFQFAEPPVIQSSDERPIILMASIIIKNGSLENSAWNASTWRDAEIYYSNIEGAKQRESSISRDIKELESMLRPPVKRLAHTKKGHLPGYKDNPYDRKTGNL